MKVLIIRGPFLNKWEMQNYEPLIDEIDIAACYSKNNWFDVNQIILPKRKFESFEHILSFTGFHFGHYMLGLESQLKTVDIAHTSDTYRLFSYQAIRVKKKYRIKVVVTQWENIPFLGEEKFIIKEIKKKVRSNTDLFIAVTERAKQALIYEGVPDERISVIPMGVNTEIFKPGGKNEHYLTKYGLNDEDIIILFTGRLVWEKGIFDLIYAFEKILKNKPICKNIHLLIVGSGDQQTRKKIDKLINELNISKSVYFIGSVPYVQMPHIYNLADIFVLPSIPTPKSQEQLGMALIEAMACGKPVISTTTGSIEEVVGNAGILTQPNDPLSLSRKIEELIQDDTLRRKLSKLARERVEDLFDSKKIAERIKKEYQKLLK